jgi:hypothetical protein
MNDIYEDSDLDRECDRIEYGGCRAMIVSIVIIAVIIIILKILL